MSVELKAAVDGLGKAFTEFKEANDTRLRSIEEKGFAPADFEAKVDKINAAVSEAQEKLAAIETAMKRAPLVDSKGQPLSQEVVDHKAAFSKFMRKGDDIGLTALEQKALNITTGEDGGYAVPEELDRSIENLLLASNPMRALAGQITVGTSDYKKLVNKRGAASGWVDEDDARPETDAPKLGIVAPAMGEIYANPGATQTALDDMFFNAENWLAEELAAEFDYQEGVAFVTGDGTKKPLGFLASPTAATADSARAFGTLEHVATGVAGDWAAANPSDILFDVEAKMKAGYKTGAGWTMNGLTIAAIRKFKDGNGNYLWQPGLQAGQAQSLLGKPLTQLDAMPNIGADALAIGYGNFKRGYLIVDRMGTRVLRDPFTNKPYVHFYATKRVGGQVVNSEAIKLVKFAVA